MTLKEGEYLSLFSQEDSEIHFYYSTSAVTDAAGVVDNGFYSRLPILYGSGTNWSLTTNMSLGWSFGYQANENGGNTENVGSGEGEW